MTILLVDDDLSDARLIREILERQDPELTIINADTCEDALRLADTETIDCIVMDQRLPGLQGSKCVAALREQGYQGGFVLLTGFADPYTAVEAMKNKADDYLDKGLIRERLLSAIRTAVSIRSDAVAKQKEAIAKNRRIDDRIEELERSILDLKRERRGL